MPSAVTISQPDVVALIEQVAARFTDGDKTEAVALALRRLQDADACVDSLFGAHKGSVVMTEGVDLTAPILQDGMEADTGPVL